MKKHNNTKKHIMREYQLSSFDDKRVAFLSSLPSCESTINIKNATLENNYNENCIKNNMIDEKMLTKCENIINIKNATLENNHNENCIKNSVTEKIPKKKNKSANDMTNNIPKHICECGKEFSHHSSLSRHKRSCFNILPHTQNNTQAHEIEALKAQINKMQKTIDELNEKTTNQQLINTTNSNNKVCSENTVNTINNKTINVYTYLNSAYNEAPPIKMLESNDITKLLAYAELGDHSLEDMIVFQHGKHLLSQFLGEFILKGFKKSDPKKQQFWISDVPRLNFIVRQVINQNEAVWRPDKKGVCLSKYIITPMLEAIKILLIEYSKLCKSKMQSVDISQCEKISEQNKNSIEVIYEINQKILHHKILNHIAPYFQLELTHDEILDIE
jgi:hypothetical protein